MVADEISRTVWPYVEGGRLRPVIDSIFPLAEAAAAHARMEAGEHVGKIVLRDPATDRGASMTERLVLHEYSASGNCYKVRLTAALARARRWTGVNMTS